MELPMQERFRHLELPVHGGGRDVQGGGGFFIREATEAQEFNDFALAHVMCGKPLYGEVQLDNAGLTLWADHNGIIEWQLFHSAAALPAAMRLSMVNQDAPEYPGRNGKEMDSVLPLDISVH